MKMLGIVAVGVVRQSRKFSGHPYVGRGHLCDSTAFLLPVLLLFDVEYEVMPLECGDEIWRQKTRIIGLPW